MEIGRSILEAMKAIYSQDELASLIENSQSQEVAMEDPMLDQQNQLLQVPKKKQGANFTYDKYKINFEEEDRHKKYKDDFNLGEIVINQGLDESFSSSKHNSPLITEKSNAELKKQASVNFTKPSPGSNKKVKPNSGDLNLNRFQSY